MQNCACVCIQIKSAFSSTIAHKLLIKYCCSQHQLCQSSRFIKTSSGKNSIGLHLTFVFKFVFYKRYSYPPTPVLPPLCQTGGVPTVCCCVCSRVVWLACSTLSAANSLLFSQQLKNLLLLFRIFRFKRHVASSCDIARPRQQLLVWFSIHVPMLANKTSLCV